MSMDKEAYFKETQNSPRGANTVSYQTAAQVGESISEQIAKSKKHYNQIEQLEMENSKLKMEITQLKMELLNLYRARFNY